MNLKLRVLTLALMTTALGYLLTTKAANAQSGESCPTPQAQDCYNRIFANLNQCVYECPLKSSAPQDIQACVNQCVATYDRDAVECGCTLP